MEEPVNRENEKLVTLQKLNVLIHPLWRSEPLDGIDYGENTGRFDSERRQMAGEMLAQMTPEIGDEVTYFMPILNESERREDLQKQIKMIKSNGHFIQWTDLYRDMVKKVGHGRNLILGTNLVSSSRNTDPDPIAFIGDLRKKGFRVDANTKIVVGGEMLRACLETGIDNLLKLPEVTAIDVNLDATLTSGYLFNSAHSLDERDRKEFALHYLKAGLDVSEDGNHYTISKKG